MTTIARGPSSAAAEITSAAIASFDGCPDPRLRQIVQALIRHLHAFASEVQLTEDEWTRAIEILTRTGHITDDRRQEFILWSDALGLSMLVDALAHPSANGATESTVLGPFWTPNAPRRGYAESIAAELRLSVRVVSVPSRTRREAPETIAIWVICAMITVLPLLRLVRGRTHVVPGSMM